MITDEMAKAPPVADAEVEEVCTALLDAFDNLGRPQRGGTRWLVNPDGPEAAAMIRRLASERDEARAAGRLEGLREAEKIAERLNMIPADCEYGYVEWDTNAGVCRLEKRGGSCQCLERAEGAEAVAKAIAARIKEATAQSETAVASGCGAGAGRMPPRALQPETPDDAAHHPPHHPDHHG